jgi:hypothetical protein
LTAAQNDANQRVETIVGPWPPKFHPDRWANQSMKKIRQWINKDDGKWFQIGNENLNSLEIIGFGFMVLGFLLFPMIKHVFPDSPKLIPISALIVAVCFLMAGTLKKRK